MSVLLARFPPCNVPHCRLFPVPAGVSLLYRQSTSGINADERIQLFVHMHLSADMTKTPPSIDVRGSCHLMSSRYQRIFLGNCFANPPARASATTYMCDFMSFHTRASSAYFFAFKASICAI